MIQGGVPVHHALYNLVKECIKKKDLAASRELYSHITKRGLEPNVFLGSHLIRMFALCGSLSDSNWIFNSLPDKNLWTWSMTIDAHVKVGQNRQAIKLYQRFQQTSIKSNEFIFVAVLKACADVVEGTLIHAYILESGMESDVHVGNTLIGMYAKFGSMEDASTVFKKLPKQDVVSWNAIITSHIQCGHGQQAVQLFLAMHLGNVQPNSVTLLSLLKACSEIEALDEAKLIHICIIKSGFETNLFIGSMLIDIYAKGGSLEDAKRTFESLSKEDVVTWNAMIAGCINCEHYQGALQLFNRMAKEDVKPNNATLASTIQACSNMAVLDEGRLTHIYAIKSDVRFNSFIGSSLIDMYARCGDLEDARNVFDRLLNRDVVTWNAMMAGYTQHGHGREALHVFDKMHQACCKPDAATFVIALKACSITIALDQGQCIHFLVIDAGFDFNIIINNILIDMYARCGNLEDAGRVFDKMSKRDTWTWNAMIAGVTQHGNHDMAWDYFRKMQQEGLDPIHVTFVSLLSVCSHRGFFDEGCVLFKSIRENYGIAPTVELYNCMVDVLGRAGCLNQAEDILLTMPFEFNLLGWMSLLTNCKTHSNLEIGKRCFKHVYRIDFKYASGYQLMSSIYAGVDMLEDLHELQLLKSSVSAWKKPGQAFVEASSTVHGFIVGDTRHFQSDDIHALTKRLSMQIKGKGHVPNVDLVLLLFEDDK